MRTLVALIGVLLLAPAPAVLTLAAVENCGGCPQLPLSEGAL